MKCARQCGLAATCVASYHVQIPSLDGVVVTTKRAEYLCAVCAKQLQRKEGKRKVKVTAIIEGATP